MTDILDAYRFADPATKRLIERRVAAGAAVEILAPKLSAPREPTPADQVVDNILRRLDKMAHFTTNPSQRLGVQNAIRIIKQEFLYHE